MFEPVKAPDYPEYPIMSTAVRCTCPSCRGVYRVPEYAIGTEHKCPHCKRTVIISACGGQTVLELAGVDGGAATTDDLTIQKPVVS